MSQQSAFKSTSTCSQGPSQHSRPRKRGKCRQSTPVPFLVPTYKRAEHVCANYESKSRKTRILKVKKFVVKSPSPKIVGYGPLTPLLHHGGVGGQQTSTNCKFDMSEKVYSTMSTSLTEISKHLESNEPFPSPPLWPTENTQR